MIHTTITQYNEMLLGIWNSNTHAEYLIVSALPPTYGVCVHIIILLLTLSLLATRAVIMVTDDLLNPLSKQLREKRMCLRYLQSTYQSEIGLIFNNKTKTHSGAWWGWQNNTAHVFLKLIKLGKWGTIFHIPLLPHPLPSPTLTSWLLALS